MFDEERHPYSGPGSLPDEWFDYRSNSIDVMVLDVDAVLPQPTEQPRLTRVEQATVEAYGGWSTRNGFAELGGWEKRVREATLGAEAIFVLADRNDGVRGRAVKTALTGAVPCVRSEAWELQRWSSGQPEDFYVASLEGIVQALAHCHRRVRKLTTHLVGNDHVMSGVRDRFRLTDPNLCLEVIQAHPTLGIIPHRLSLPDEDPLFELEQWLELRAPYPGEIKPNGRKGE